MKKYYVSDQDADYIANYVGAAFVAHYNGDDAIANSPLFDENKLGVWGKLIYSQQKYVIDSLWKDLPPGDNNLTIDLNKSNH